jgi:hypothetical protein
MDRLNTKDIILRKHWEVHDGPHCVLCDQHVLETRDHLFFLCPFAVNCWNRIGVFWDCSLNISDRLLEARILLDKPFFLEVFASATWNI